MIVRKKHLFLPFMRFQLHTYYHSEDIPSLPGKNIFYSKEIFQVYENTPGYSPVLAVAYDGANPLAKILAVTRRGKGLRGWLIRRCEVFGTGEYFCEDPALQEYLFSEMLEYLTSIVLKKAWMVIFRNLTDPLFGYKAFRENNYFPIKWVRMLSNFRPGKSLLNYASPSRRRQIRRGLQSGTTLQEATLPEDVKEFSEMLRRNYSGKVRKHFPSVKFFEYFNKILISNGMGSIYIVKFRGHIIGGSVVLYSGEVAYLIFNGGMNKSYKWKYPGILSVWKSLNEASSRGCKYMEYIDAGLPFQPHGFREFALRFGAKTTGSRRWFRFRWAWINKIMIKIYS